MGENSECKSCKTWEEDMYWRHFSFMHFCVALPSDFHDHLRLPEKFAAHMKVTMPNKVSVKGPSGDVWDIDLLKTDDLLFAGDEWKAFVKANDLKENCFLVFKYNRNSNFEVLIFDQESSCERESAYFVRKCIKRAMRDDGDEEEDDDDDDDGDTAEKAKKPVLAASKRRGRTKRAAHESPDQPNVQSKNQTLREDITPENGQDDVPEKEPSRNRRAKEWRQDSEIPNDNGPCFQATDHSNKLEVQTEKRPKTNGTSKELLPETRERLPVTGSARAEMVPNEPNGHTSEKMVRPDYREISSDEDHSSKSRGKRGGGRGRGGGRVRAGSKLPTSPQKLVFNSEGVSDGRRFAKEYISERRPVTEVEKENTLQRAMENVTEHSFIAAMRPTAVYKRFFLSIPLDWVQKHLSSRSNEFVLRVGGRTWHTRLCRYYGNKSVGFSTGWKKFSLENSLEEFDVLLFKLVDHNNENGAVVMNVDIFRVVDNIVPLLPVVS